MSKAGGVFLCLSRAVNCILPSPGAELHVSVRVAVVGEQVRPAVGSKCLKTLECSACVCRGSCLSGRRESLVEIGCVSHSCCFSQLLPVGVLELRGREQL